MCDLIVTEHGSVVGTENGRVYVRLNDQELPVSIPVNHLDSIVMMSNSTVTTYMIKLCLTRKIPIIYTTSYGSYLGALRSEQTCDTELQRLQCSLYDKSFAVELSKRIVSEKIKNQSLVLYRHRNEGDFSQTISRLNLMRKRVFFAETVDGIRGLEGASASLYFKAFGCLTMDFPFLGRSKRPPLDEVNAMLSYGYSFLGKMITSLIVNHGINPYFGFYHKDARGHTTLVSDLIEGWRSVVVDSAVLTLIRKRMILKCHFRQGDNRGIYLNKEGVAIVSDLLRRKISQPNYSDESNDGKTTIIAMLSRQVKSLIKAMRTQNCQELWSPCFK